MFSAETYLNRRNTLSSKIDSGILLFLGNIENPINFEHNTYPFRQDSNFLYYFGIKSPKLAAIIDIDEQKTIVFGNELSIDEIVWMGRQETLKEKCIKSGIEICLPFQELFQYITKATKSGRSIHYLPPYQSFNKILLSELLSKAIPTLKASEQFIKAVVSQRSIKEALEISEIEKALAISSEMHLLAIREANEGKHEFEVTSAMQKFAMDHNCTFAYPPIVTIHGEILHNQYNQHILKNGDLLLNDSGVETPMGYAADLTRTFPISSSFTTKQREIYDIVLQSFKDSRDIMAPNIKFKDVYYQASRSLINGLKNIGLMKGDTEEALSINAHTLFFQCGLGHMMGLDVHDMEDLGEQYVGYTEAEPKDTKTFGIKSLRLGKALEPGYVLTVEPGIYIIPELIDIWKAEKKCSDFINYEKLESYRDFRGIRIEDNFLITEEGFRLLEPELIKEATDIENYRQKYI